MCEQLHCQHEDVQEPTTDNRDLVIKQLEEELEKLKTVQSPVLSEGYSSSDVSKVQLCHAAGVLKRFLEGREGVTELEAAGIAQPDLLFNIARNMYNSELTQYTQDLQNKEAELGNLFFVRESRTTGMKRFIGSLGGPTSKSWKVKRKSPLSGKESYSSSSIFTTEKEEKPVPSITSYKYDFSQLEPGKKFDEAIIDHNKELVLKIKKLENEMAKYLKENSELMTKMTNIRFQLKSLKLSRENEQFKHSLEPANIVYDKYGDVINITQEQIYLDQKESDLRSEYMQAILNSITTSNSYSEAFSELNEEKSKL